MDGSETAVIDMFRVFQRPDIPIPDRSQGHSIEALLGIGDFKTQLIPCGQDASLAASLSQRFPTAGRLVSGLERTMDQALAGAAQNVSLAEGGALADFHGIRYPILQGPMTRVSDTVDFAAAVADAGGLPFIALAMLRESACRKLLNEAKARFNGRTWGVGILGFVDQDLRSEQFAVIEEVMPPVVIIAGGRPTQARALEEKGIAAYLHVPSRGLLELFLADGARRFIFEGRECGGHIGPRFSFLLWQQQIDVLMQFPRPRELFVVFAGGIHDTRSAAMITAMTASLAAKGAKIGILMGTAYLFTEEAVACGAILQTYQDQAIACARTVLLETAPGHATRCIDSPYVRSFLAERQRLDQAGTDPKEVWATLETLNLGRLRIASKGVKRFGSELLPVEEEKQRQEGMYMIGDVATMRERVITVEDLHKEVTERIPEYLQALVHEVAPEEEAQPLDIAIVGMAGVFPGAEDIDTFWSNIIKGVRCFSEVDPARWNPRHYFNPDSNDGDRTPSKWGGFLGDIIFDPTEYGIPPQSLSTIDPAQLISLEVARRALDDAGYLHGDFDRSRVSVVFGAEAGSDISAAYGFRSLYPQLVGELPPELDEHLPRLREDSFPGILANVIAGRITNRLDLGGLNMSVDAACASSLAALDSAAKELILGRSDMVLCGAADLHNSINDFLLFSGVHAMSRAPYCRTFDSEADGTVLGEAVACVVLKRLADAERDGDRIYAVIKGIGTSSDGRSLGLTAPNTKGQVSAVRRAYAFSGLRPQDVGLVEAHGTGTVVGDRTELRTLNQVFEDDGVSPGSCTLGSVKSQIGHTKCAAGLASLIKAAKSLYHGILPPTININRPNPEYEEDKSPFTLSDYPRPWLKLSRSAGVSAFGFGGANFHTVMSSYNGGEPPAKGFEHWPWELLLLRGGDQQMALGQARKLLTLLERNLGLKLRDLAATLASQGEGRVQFALVAESLEDLKAKLSGLVSGRIAEDVFAAGEQAGEIAFLFPGQGSQRPGMQRDLFITFPELRPLLELGKGWIESLIPPAAWSQARADRQMADITDTRRAQPCLGIVELALAKLLRRAGIDPDCAGGHSYGELVALAMGGAFSDEDLLALSHERAEAIIDAAGTEPGRMLAVAERVDRIQALLNRVEGVVIANHNAPEQVVVSGTEQAIANAKAQLHSAGIMAHALPVGAAFHSPVVAGAQKRLGIYLEDMSVGELRLPVWSNTTAAPYVNVADSIKRTLAEQVALPVRFVDQINNMYEAGIRTFIEVGPGKVLTGLVGMILKDKPHQCIACDSDRGSGLRGLLRVLGGLAVAGKEIDTTFLFEGRHTVQLELDNPESLEPPKTAWKINGWLARPINGQVPQNRLRPAADPVYLPTRNVPAAAAPAPLTDTAVLSYLENLREFAAAQRDVMIGYLGLDLGTLPKKIEARGTSTSQSVNARVLAESAPKAAELKEEQTVGIDPANMEAELLSIVSHKTGYPKDLLGLDLDLEADLSIDSIKRVEILGELQKQLRINGDGTNDRDHLVEQLAAKKTLREIISWLAAQNVTDDSQRQLGAPPRAKGIRALDFEASLLSLVSDKTGYPKEMLGLDQDLEAELSIDSIKRVEILGTLADEVGINRIGGQDRDRLIEGLAAMKTLREILDWLWTQAELPLEQEPSGGLCPAENLIDIEKALLALVSEKTGYPSEMLGLDMDLEAELSIDSIKRVEILGALSNQVGVVQDDDQSRDQMIEELAAKKTLRDILDCLQQKRNDPNDITQVIGSEGANTSEIRVRRYVPVLEELPEAVTDFRSIRGKRIGFTWPNGPFGDSLRMELEKHGATAVALQENAPWPDLDGVVYLTALREPHEPDLVRELFAVARKSATRQVGLLYAVTALGGRFGRTHGLNGELMIGGISGLMKTVAKEHPEIQVRTIDIAPDTPPESLALILITELATIDSPAEIGYRNGRRATLRLVLAEEIPEEGDLFLTPESVVVITGGARGITAGVAIELARRFQCRLVLVGRSPLPDAQDASIFPDAHTLAELRTALSAEVRFKDPKSINAECHRIMCAREILHTLGEIDRAGSSCEYHSLDVRDELRFGSLIDDIYQRLGRLDGIIHGAGIIEDKLLVDKEPSSFDRVFDTKINAARVLTAKLKRDTSFVVFFSSVSGVFGNRGQIDYAAAGDVLDKSALRLQQQIAGRVLSVDWGPWGGTGMVSDALAEAYASRGIGLIPPQQGIACLMEELGRTDCKETQVIYIAAEPAAVSREAII